MTKNEAIKIMQNEQPRYKNPTYFSESDRYEAYHMAIEALKDRPTGWIPVSERLPEESLNSVIGWDTYRERCVFVQYIDGHFQITGSNESFNIVAWMPLPLPYEAESEDNR